MPIGFCESNICECGLSHICSLPSLVEGILPFFWVNAPFFALPVFNAHFDIFTQETFSIVARLMAGKLLTNTPAHFC